MSADRFTVTILGSNSALPANNRFQTSQLLNAGEQYYLIDCGEGTQMQLRRYRVKIQRIGVIFISHLHGDHYFGLPGLLNTLHLLGRTKKMILYGPNALKDILDIQMSVANTRFNYPIEFRGTDHVFNSKGLISIYEDKRITVAAFPLKHRINCSGFKFSQKPGSRKYLPKVGAKYGVPIRSIPGIKSGADFVNTEGEVISNSLLTEDPPLPKTYVYCTDTLPTKIAMEASCGADCLYHESTFMEADSKRAKQTFHSTARQAAELAKQASVSKLLLGHFSARYDDLGLMLNEAKDVFRNSELAIEGTEVDI